MIYTFTLIDSSADVYFGQIQREYQNTHRISQTDPILPFETHCVPATIILTVFLRNSLGLLYCLFSCPHWCSMSVTKMYLLYMSSKHPSEKWLSNVQCPAFGSVTLKTKVTSRDDINSIILFAFNHLQHLSLYLLVYTTEDI